MALTPRPAALTRRTLLAGGAAATAAAVLAACSGSNGASGSSDGSSSASGASASGSASAGATDSFPVTIDHVYGSTTIEAAPTRVATVSWVNQDVVLALGVVPVGVPEVTWGSDDNGSFPWTSDALSDLGAGWGSDAAPAQYSETDGINVQEIAALEPDLIIGTYSGMTEDEYTQLSAIAPTLAYPEGTAAYGTSWQDSTTTIGRALGRSSAAEELVSSTTSTIQDTAAQYPALSGSSYIAATADATTQSISVYTAADNRPRFFDLLGMTMAESAIDAGAGTQDEFFVEVSAENADTLASDLFWAWANDDAAVTAIEGDALLSTIPAVADGTAMFVTDATTVMSLSGSSPLSLPWCCTHHVPAIADALGAAPSASSSAS